MSRYGRALWALLIWSTSLCADDRKVDFSAFEKIVQSELASSNTPGAAIAVVRGDRMIYAKGFGVANVETNEPITPQTLFRLGSTTKMFTAATLVSLAREGKVKLDQPIDAVVKGLNAKVGKLTPHQLLTHTAGLKDEAPMYGLQEESALGKGIRAWMDDVLVEEPGKTYAYSNPGYWLAGLVIEEVDGRPYADMVHERLLKPLGMTRSTFRPTMAMTYPLAQGHQVVRGRLEVIRPLANNAATWPAGSLFSCTQDLARFATAFLNEGQLDGKPALDPELIHLLTKPHVTLSAKSGHYGYGLIVGKVRGVTVFEHGGARSGYGSMIRFLPEQKTAIILLINKSAGRLPISLDALTSLCLFAFAEKTKP